VTAPELPERAQKILSGEVPAKLRRGLATAAVPMPPEELLPCLAVIAAKDADADLRQTAQKTLAELPPNLKQTAVQGNFAPPVFRVIRTFVPLDPTERERFYLNQAVPDDVLTRMAADEDNEKLLEILIGNQQRMLRYAALAETLMDNPNLSPALRAKLEEFFTRAFAGKLLLQQGLKTRDELAEDETWADQVDELVEAAETSDQDAETEELPEELLAQEEEEEELDREDAKQLLEEAESQEEEEEKPTNNLRAQLANMAVTQKIKLALLGGKQARSLLVFDSNKIISSMVLKNPRITDSEVQAIASSKSVREDLLRQIARDKQMMKNYSVKQALVKNPKTPIKISLNLLNQMREHDLKRLAKSRNVPNAVQQQARRLMMRKQR